MADTDAKVTEEQVKAANQAEESKLQGDFTEEELTVPYKREDAKDEQKTDDGDEEDAGAAGTTEPENEEGTTTYSDPAPVITVQDPGEYQPADYSFEIEIKGKTHKVDSAESAADLAEEFADDLTAKQIVALMTKSANITYKQERDKEQWESRKKTFDDQTATAAERNAVVENIAGEFDYLVSKKLLPEVAKEYKDADWSDPEVAKQPGVKEQVALLKYMTKENELRAKAKVKPMTSIVDAYNAWKLETGKQEEVDANKKAGEARKAASSRVAGVAPSNQGLYVPKGIAVGRVMPKRSVAQWDN